MCKCAKTFFPDPLPGICSWTPLGEFRHRTSSLVCVYSRPLFLGGIFPLKIPEPTTKKIDETEEPEARSHGWMTLTKLFIPICLYCLNCANFVQLILRRIIKTVATRCQILSLKCTQFDFGWSSALGVLTALPQTLSWT